MIIGKRMLSRFFIALLSLFFASLTLAAGKGINAQEALIVEKRLKEYASTQTALYPTIKFPHHQCFVEAADKHDIPLPLLIALGRGESNFNAKAVSSANAIGVLQILWPATANDLGIHKRSDLENPCINIEAGARYLKGLIKRYDGDLYRALAAYNYGPGRIKTGQSIPSGAAWYSGYILNHLEYVLTRSSNRNIPPDHKYTEEQQLTLITFSQPLRTKAYIDYMKKNAPDVRLDWFREDTFKYRISLLYLSEKEKLRSVASLRKAGFHVKETP